MFILCLALSDLLYCAFSLPFYAVTYLMQDWPLGQEMCYAFAALRHIVAYADWMFLAFIAVSRCAKLIWREKAHKYLSGRSGYAVVFLVWSYAVGLNSPILAGVYRTYKI